MRHPIRIPPISEEKHHIPADYATVPLLTVNMKSANPPNGHIPMDCSNDGDRVKKARNEEEHWLQHVSSTMETYDSDSDTVIGWAAHHSLRQPVPSNDMAVIAMLPLFEEKSSDPSMVRHGMDVIREATSFLNPTQVPVITVDQALFATVKSIQWKWPLNYGEDRYVAMLGGLHIEMALWSTLRNLLVDSGWTDVIADTGIATSGVANSLLNCASVKRTRYAHQVTASVL